MAEKLAKGHINISYAYCTAGAKGGRTTGVLKVSDVKKAMRLLEDHNKESREHVHRAPVQRRRTLERRASPTVALRHRVASVVAAGQLPQGRGPVRVEAEDLVQIGDLEDPLQLRAQRRDRHLAAVGLQAGPCLQQQPQDLRREELDAVEVEDDALLGRLVSMYCLSWAEALVISATSLMQVLLNEAIAAFPSVAMSKPAFVSMSLNLPNPKSRRHYLILIARRRDFCSQVTGQGAAIEG